MSQPKDLLLLVWVHGFKGNEVTFESFPERLVHLLQSTHPSLRVESNVFPAYQTRGELHAATLAFVDWLTELVVKLECNHGEGGGAGKARVVLMGHSMGGLLIADAARDIAVNTRPGAPMWPHVVGVLAFDTPYLGLHPHTFKHGLSTAASYYEQARGLASAAGILSPLAVGWGASMWGSKTPTPEKNASAGPSRPRTPSSTVSDDAKSATKSSSWLPAASTKTLYGAAAMALGAAAVGTAYYRREDFLNGWKWGFEHMTFVKNLWDDQAMKARLEGIDELGRDRKVVFRNFYTHLPPDPPANLISRTFCILPPTTHPLYSRFVQASNTLAKDEVSAHMGMFNPKTNEGFYDLGLAVVRCIGERIEEEGVGRVGEVTLDAVEQDGKGKDGEKDGVSGMAGWKEEKQGGKVVWVEQ